MEVEPFTLVFLTVSGLGNTGLGIKPLGDDLVGAAKADLRITGSTGMIDDQGALGNGPGVAEHLPGKLDGIDTPGVAV